MTIPTDKLKLAIEAARKATKGKWKQGYSDDSGPECVTVKGKSIAQTNWTGPTWEIDHQAKDNAKHIATMSPAFSIEVMTELLELREAVKWYKGVNAVVDPAGKIQALTEANKIAVEALYDISIGKQKEDINMPDISIDGRMIRVAQTAFQKIKSVMGEEK